MVLTAKQQQRHVPRKQRQQRQTTFWSPRRRTQSSILSPATHSRGALEAGADEGPTALQCARTSVSTTDNGSWRERMTRGHFKIEKSCLRSCVSLSISSALLVSAGRRRAKRESRGKCDTKEEKKRETSSDTRLFCLLFGCFYHLVSVSVVSRRIINI